jgi:hopene-associated glycosyltransferase HpnB
MLPGTKSSPASEPKRALYVSILAGFLKLVPMGIILAAICAALWAYLLAGRGHFWLGSVNDALRPPAPQTWPSVVVIIPARNEADVILASVGSLLRQNYRGQMAVIVVDDDSNDGTGALVTHQAKNSSGRRMEVLASRGLPTDWTGKLWALQQGIAFAEKSIEADYLLLTDADIVHEPDTLEWLVGHAVAGDYVLTSLMAKLRCQSIVEWIHIPAFIYFFQMLFPFAWVGRPDASTAAAAGGCMLVRADALGRAGGIASVRNALIDDCSLAARLKAVGPIWLGLTDRVRSIRRYDTFADAKQMITRSAYAQLRYSPLLLVGTVAGMALTFVAGPLLAIFGAGLPQYLGAAVWLAMAVSFWPTLRSYRLSPLWALALPLIACLYTFYTLISAYQYLGGRGGQWKGRVHVNAPSLQ